MKGSAVTQHFGLEVSSMSLTRESREPARNRLMPRFQDPLFLKRAAKDDGANQIAK